MRYLNSTIKNMGNRIPFFSRNSFFKSPFSRSPFSIRSSFIMPAAFVSAALLAAAHPSMAAESSATPHYVAHEKAKVFVDRMVKEHGFERQYIQSVLAQAEKKQSILDAISRPAEKTKAWHEYRKIFIQDVRIKGGVAFWQEHKAILDDVSSAYGVPAEIIVAIIGVETRYGNYMGSYRVVDALATLGFDYPKRGKFFTRQLEELFLLGREQQQDILTLKGSYAGAMGFGQFIPSSYRSFAVDYDGDDVADIWANKKDAIASVANYFKAHGWQTGEAVVERAHRAEHFPSEKINSRSRPTTSAKTLYKEGFSPLSRKAVSDKPAIALEYQGANGPEHWLGYNNFYVITRYNRSHLYAMAVYQLSQEIALAYKEAKPKSSAKPNDQAAL